MRKRNQHITPHTEGWSVKGAGSTRASSVHRTQAEAIAAGRAVSQKQGTELIIHGRDGKIREKDSHDRDPYPPKG